MPSRSPSPAGSGGKRSPSPKGSPRRSRSKSRSRSPRRSRSRSRSRSPRRSRSRSREGILPALLPHTRPQEKEAHNMPWGPRCDCMFAWGLLPFFVLLGRLPIHIRVSISFSHTCLDDNNDRALSSKQAAAAVAVAAAAAAVKQGSRRALLPGGLTVGLGSSNQKTEAVRINITITSTFSPSFDTLAGRTHQHWHDVNRVTALACPCIW